MAWSQGKTPGGSGSTSSGTRLKRGFAANKEFQEATDKAVLAPTESSAVITQISNLYTAIAVALEKQTDNSKEIGRNASGAAPGSKELAKHISNCAKNRPGRPKQPANWRRVYLDIWMATALQDLVNRLKISLSAAFYAPERRGLYR